MVVSEKRIEDLKGLKFNVPSYQRGYRWTEHEVTTLLEDLYTHSKQNRDYLIYPLFLTQLKIRSLFLLSIRNTKERMPIMMCYRSRLCLMTIIFIVWHIKLKKKMED